MPIGIFLGFSPNRWLMEEKVRSKARNYSGIFPIIPIILMGIVTLNFSTNRAAVEIYARWRAINAAYPEL